MHDIMGISVLFRLAGQEFLAVTRRSGDSLGPHWPFLAGSSRQGGRGKFAQPNAQNHQAFALSDLDRVVNHVVSIEQGGRRYRLTNSRLIHGSASGAGGGRTTDATMVSPSEGNEARRNGRQGVAASHSTVEAGEPNRGTPSREGGAVS